jgi:putative addiction module CopG family antidote
MPESDHNSKEADGKMEKSRHERFSARSDGRICPPKVAIGDYETANEVVREGLRLLKQSDEVWKADVRDKLKAWIQSAPSYRSSRAGPS